MGIYLFVIVIAAMAGGIAGWVMSDGAKLWQRALCMVALGFDCGAMFILLAGNPADMTKPRPTPAPTPIYVIIVTPTPSDAK